jgi:hypothetical protein
MGMTIACAKQKELKQITRVALKNQFVDADGITYKMSNKGELGSPSNLLKILESFQLNKASQHPLQINA